MDSTSGRTILVVDDEREYRELAEAILAPMWQTVCAADGSEAMRLATTLKPDLILLDIRIPGDDGVLVCEQLRSHEITRHIPIVMMTAAPEVDVRVRAFAAGADDYITKPFTEPELKARVSSKLRRIDERVATPKIHTLGNLVIDDDRAEARIGGEKAPLTFLELSLLRYLVANKDRVASRKDILSSVWKDTVITDRTVDSHIAALRRKLSAFDHQVVTVHKVGYTLKKIESPPRAGNG